MDYPTSAYIFTTNRCNLACKYCYETNRTGDMSKETMRKSIDWLVSHYKKNCFARPGENLTFTFFGGEPLLNFPVVKTGILYLQNLCQELEFRAGVHILSNGTIFTDEMEDFFGGLRKSNNFNLHFQVSLDGCKDSHDKNRVFAQNESKGSYDTIAKNIARIRKTFRSLGIRQTIVPENIKNLSKDFASLLDFKANTTNLTPIVEGNWSIDVQKDLVIELEKCADIYFEKGGKGYTNIIHHIIEKMNDPNYTVQHGCMAGRHLYGISIDGDIYPCHRFVAYSKIKDFKLGNIREGIDYDSENFKFTSQMHTNAKKCGQCKVFSCNRCFASYMNLMADPLTIPDNGYCEMNTVMSETLTKIIWRLLMEGKLKLNKGDLVTNGEKVAFNATGETEIVGDLQDAIARCLVLLTKEMTEVKQRLEKLETTCRTTIYKTAE